MEKTFNVDQWEWSALTDQAEKHLRKSVDDLTRCIERVRQFKEREADATYKAMTCTRDSEYMLKDRADASQSKQQCIRDCLEILTQEMPVSIDLIKTALYKALQSNE